MKAVATMCLGPHWQDLSALTLPTIKSYAGKVGADFVPLNKQDYPHMHYQKFQVYDLLGHYSRVLWVDADAIIRADCPDLFGLVAPEHWGAVDELPWHPDGTLHVTRSCQELGLQVPAIHHYFNTGMFVASRVHRPIFKAPEIMVSSKFPEQNHINTRLCVGRYPVHCLPWTFNVMKQHQTGRYWLQAYILHYSDRPMQERIAAATHDMAYWSACPKWSKQS